MKPRLAFFDFASCEGCQLQVVNLEAEMLDLVDKVDIVEFREAMSETTDGPIDIAFVEGSIVRQKDEARLQRIRERASILVALGACAHIGGVNCIRNFQPLEEVRRTVYGDKWEWFEAYEARPLSAVVKVDLAIPGCPIDKDELMRITTALLLGKKPELPEHAVCVECKSLGNQCVYELGQTCQGPVTRAGCNARCTSVRSGCEGCRGLVPEPNVNSHKEVLEKYGLSLEESKGRYRLFCGYSEVAK